jgi:hypothetical protein
LLRFFLLTIPFSLANFSHFVGSFGFGILIKIILKFLRNLKNLQVFLLVKDTLPMEAENFK